MSLGYLILKSLCFNINMIQWYLLDSSSFEWIAFDHCRKHFFFRIIIKTHEYYKDIWWSWVSVFTIHSITSLHVSRCCLKHEWCQWEIRHFVWSSIFLFQKVFTITTNKDSFPSSCLFSSLFYISMSQTSPVSVFPSFVV